MNGMPKSGPDLSRGIALAELDDGVIHPGHVGDDQVLLVRTGGECFAVGAHCSHYGVGMAGGLVIGDTIRCPMHHACFNLRRGEALRAPAFDPIPRWRVERIGDRVFVRERQGSATPEPAATAAQSPQSAENIVILGGGAAGHAAADMLRREGHRGGLTMVSADADAPYDRPNLSKDLLAGVAPVQWLPLRSAAFYVEREIELVLGTRAVGLDLTGRELSLDNGRSLAFDALLLATGAVPVRLPVDGDVARVRYLRNIADARDVLAAATTARTAVVIGASFLGLEVAASLRSRGIGVDVVAPEPVPMQRVLGDQVGLFLQALHEGKGVRFHLGTGVVGIDGSGVRLADGTTLTADLVVAAVGVRPATELAEQAGLIVDRGVVVDEYLETSAPGVFAAGDIARWPDRRSGQRIRVEHWVVAERQGQVAAMNMLGRRQLFDAVPFFWSRHYEVGIKYVGHAEGWDTVEVDGNLSDHDCAVRYLRGGRLLALATIGRDRLSLETEVAMERAQSAPPPQP